MRIDNVLGIVVEYNPFHNGHLYHLRRSRELSGADAVVAVMSGPFLQRGEPALVNKWARTEMALKAGVDLVIELPVLFSAQAAEWFAYGAVTALEATGVVNRLCFGSESGQIDWMLQLARLLAQEPRALKDELKRRLARGMRYPDAYSEAVATVIGQNEAHVTKEQLSRPNNTLGLHYLIALERIQSRIIPMTISRTEAEYDETILRGGSIASATAIRRRWLTEGTLDSLSPYIPRSTLDILHREFACGRAPIHWERYWLPLCHQILSQSLDSLRDIYEVTEGLEYRIVRQLNRLHEPQNFEAYLHALKTKRYTRTKLQRTLLRILLHHSKRMFTRSVLATGTPYLRILGMTPTGQKLLKRMKTTATVPIVQQPARHPSALLELDLRASAVYALGYPDSRTNGAHDEFVQAPLVLRSGQ